MEGASMIRPKTKILVDGGDPQETGQVKELLGFVDGLTTNPGLYRLATGIPASDPIVRRM